MGPSGGGLTARGADGDERKAVEVRAAVRQEMAAATAKEDGGSLMVEVTMRRNTLSTFLGELGSSL